MPPRDISKTLRIKFEHEPTHEQNLLMDMLVELLYNPIQIALIIKGYAGTGKTSVISALIKTLPSISIDTVLLAPTGRAAKVLSEYSNHKAFTIHKKIYRIMTSKEGYSSLKLQENKHKNTLFIVDEASMIPDFSSTKENSMFSEHYVLRDLIQYVNEGSGCGLIFIGDTAQLPPVGTDESPALNKKFLNASYNMEFKEFELTEVVRQAKASGILSNATLLRDMINEEDYNLPFFDTDGFVDIKRINGAELEESLNDSYSKEGRENIVIICRSNKRANIYNQEIRKRILFQENEISTGDYMMVLKNNYFWLPEGSDAGFIANGDIIEILRINKTEDIYGFRFADVTVRLIDYPDEKDLDVKIMLDTIMLESPALNYTENRRLWDEIMLDYQDIPLKKNRMYKVKNSPHLNALQVKFAYSLTCHKTQGGQWDTVYVDQGYITKEMINTEYLRWLYTATTRAVKKLYLINFNDYYFRDKGV